MKNKIILLSISAMGFICPTSAWEDHPDRQDFRDSDSLFKDAQDQCGRETGCDYCKSEDSNDYNNSNNGASSGDGFGVPDRDK